MQIKRVNAAMNLAYPVGAVGWKLAARIGWPLCVKVQVSQSSVSTRLQAMCDALPGLAVVEDTLDEFIKTLESEIRYYLAEELKRVPRYKVDYTPVPLLA